MKGSAPDSIEFPANPFIAFVDFTIVLSLVLIVTIVHQSLSSSSLIERAAIANTQRELNQQVKQMPEVASNGSGGREPSLQETAIDGDLQRFRLKGALSFSPNSDQLTPQGRAVLIAFGRQLAARQGNPFDNKTHSFKRIIASGHASPSEGNESRVWELSLRRAQAAIDVLRQQCGIHPSLLEASGRGAYEPALNEGEASPAQVSEANRRLEIVVVYSGDIALHYLQGRNASAP